MNKLFGQLMIWIRLVIQSFHNQRFRLSLIIIQLFIGFVCIGTALGIMEGSQRFINETKQLISTDTIQIWMKSVPRNDTGDATEEDYASYLHVIKQIENNEHVEAIGSFTVENLPFDDKRYYVSFVEPSFANMLKLNLKKGRMLSPEDEQVDENDPIPAVISHKLSKDYPLGSVFNFSIPDDRTQQFVEKELQTVGVLSKDSFFWEGGGSHIIRTHTQGDYFIMLPMQPEVKNPSLPERLSVNTLIQLSDPSMIKEFTTDVRQLMKENDIDWQMHTIQDLIDEVIEDNRTVTLYTAIFALLLLGLSSLGLLGVTLGSVLQRQKEFGIRYAIGSSPLHICLLIVGEIVALVLFAALLSILALFLINVFITEDNLLFGSLVESIYIGPITIGSTFALILFLTLAVSIFPAYRAYKMEPIDMIRGTQ